MAAAVRTSTCGGRDQPGRARHRRPPQRLRLMGRGPARRQPSRRDRRGRRGGGREHVPARPETGEETALDVQVRRPVVAPDGDRALVFDGSVAAANGGHVIEPAEGTLELRAWDADTGTSSGGWHRGPGRARCAVRCPLGRDRRRVRSVGAGCRRSVVWAAEPVLRRSGHGRAEPARQRSARGAGPAGLLDRRGPARMGHRRVRAAKAAGFRSWPGPTTVSAPLRQHPSDLVVVIR